MASTDVPVATAVGLASPEGCDPQRCGGKAAALARATAAGMAVPAGVVVPTDVTAGAVGDVLERLGGELPTILDEVTGGTDAPLAVRSSSPAEDREGTSMAGRFASVVDVRGPEDLRGAVEEVLRSRDAVREETGDPDVEIAVLVQRFVEPACGGLLFTVDPVTGDRDCTVVNVAARGPEPLVSGEVEGTTYVLDRSGDTVTEHHGDGGTTLRPDQLRELAELGRAVDREFGRPQDVEWAIDGDGELWLLQSRPVTGVLERSERRPAATPARDRPVFGPGPVAETFPEPLAPLEVDLWIPPLRRALSAALRLVGAARPDAIERSPVAVVVGGMAAVDLDLFGLGPRERPLWQRWLDPRPRLRRLRASWRVGRLRGLLVGLACDLVDRVDVLLAEVPTLGGLTERQLLGLLDRTSDALVAVHGHEVLIGLLVDVDAPGLSGPSVALRVLATARAEGHDDAEIVRQHPIVLALSPPRTSQVPCLPATPSELPPRPVRGDEADTIAVLREALRIRVRWLQELHVRACLELGRRLVDRDGALDDPHQVRLLTLDELRATAVGRAVTSDVRPQSRLPSGRPLPSAFQLDDTGAVVPVSVGAEQGGTGAGGGRSRGRAHLGEEPERGDVLVVRTLDPALGPLVERLGGLVAETGSVLSHVAILAREAGVPTVVGVHDATRRFEEGQVLVVDGQAGTVEVVEGGGG